MRAWLYSVVLVGLCTAGAGAQLVINEVDYDQPGTDTAEFIEIKNTSGVPVALEDFTLVLVNGADGHAYRTIPLGPGTLQPGLYWVVCGGPSYSTCSQAQSGGADWIQNGSPDGVALIHVPTGVLVDALSYEGSITNALTPFGTFSLVEGQPTPLADDNSTPRRSLSRIPDGTDTNNAATDWALGFSTPGAPNATSCESPAGVITPGAGGACDGQQFEFVLDAHGTGPVTYRWKRDGAPLSDDAMVAGSASSRLRLVAGAETAGSYTCLMINLCGQAESGAAMFEVSNACCNPDYNQDGGADVADVLDLASDVASGTESFPPSSPDFNSDGGVDTSDILDLANVVGGGNCP